MASQGVAGSSEQGVAGSSEQGVAGGSSPGGTAQGEAGNFSKFVRVLRPSMSRCIRIGTYTITTLSLFTFCYHRITYLLYYYNNYYH